MDRREYHKQSYQSRPLLVSLPPCRKCGELSECSPSQNKSRDYRCKRCRKVYADKKNAEIALVVNKYPDAFREYVAATGIPEKLKKQVRRKVRTEIGAGRMVRQSCQVCGDIKTDAHHEDYSKPLDVDWLCSHHHHVRHMELLEEAYNEYLQVQSLRS